MLHKCNFATQNEGGGRFSDLEGCTHRCSRLLYILYCSYFIALIMGSYLNKSRLPLNIKSSKASDVICHYKTDILIEIHWILRLPLQ